VTPDRAYSQSGAQIMATKKDLIDRVAESTGDREALAKAVI
jgi:hypothetical protein